MSRTSFRVNLHSIVCLNVKKLLARSRCHIWSLRDSSEIRTHNHLVRTRTLNHLASLAKWVSVRLRTKWLWVRTRCCHLRYYLANYFQKWFYRYYSLVKPTKRGVVTLFLLLKVSGFPLIFLQRNNENIWNQ